MINYIVDIYNEGGLPLKKGITLENIYSFFKLLENGNSKFYLWFQTNQDSLKELAKVLAQYRYSTNTTKNL